MNNKKVITILIILSVILTLIGATLAYWNWQTNTTENTSVSLTVASDFSCSADGGGPITNNDIELVPSTCDNNKYAIKRMITVTPTLTGTRNVILNLWLNVVSMDDGLRASSNFRYVLTKNSETCTDSVAEGTFQNKANGSTVPLLSDIEYSSSTPDTYYLYIWLDYPETSQSTQNKNFHFTLGGNCANKPITVYTANLYDTNKPNNNSVVIGSAIPSNITQYKTPEDAMAALKTAGGGTNDYPFFLRHMVENGIVTESYVGFIISSEMASSNSGMKAGTYFLRGLATSDTNGNCKSQYLNNGNCISPYYNDNKATLLNAFGSANCNNTSSGSNCQVSGWFIGIGYNGGIGGGKPPVMCNVMQSGYSYCQRFG